MEEEKNKIKVDMDSIEKIAKKIVDEMIKKGKLNHDGKKPLTFGFSLRVEPDGTARIGSLENVRREPRGIRRAQMIRPLFNIEETDEELTITAELPGLEEKDLLVKCEPEYVRVSSKNTRWPYIRQINLPKRIVPKVEKQHLKNGILELTFKKQLTIPNIE